MSKFEIIELLIDETKSEMGINAVSVVESPAIEENFVALNEHKIELKEVDNEKRILMGAALIPNKQIYRRAKDKEFYIFFSEDTIRKASELFLIHSFGLKYYYLIHLFLLQFQLYLLNYHQVHLRIFAHIYKPLNLVQVLFSLFLGIL